MTHFIVGLVCMVVGYLLGYRFHSCGMGKPRCTAMTSGVLNVQCELREHDGPHRAKNPYGQFPIVWKQDGDVIVRMRKVMD